MSRALAGVDGCRAGWIAAIGDEQGGLREPRVFAGFAALLAALPDDALVAVDMPIGLPERIEGAGRVAEIAARRQVKRARSSLFPIPARAAFGAPSGPFTDPGERRAAYRAACDLARAHSAKGTAFSIQAFGLFPKIRELDTLLIARPDLRDRVIESHPELAFAQLNGGRDLRLPKKARDGAAWPGLAERRALLVAAGLDPRRLDAPPPKGAGRDDWLDACAMLLVAGRHARGETLSFPDPPGRDAHGLPIAIRV